MLIAGDQLTKAEAGSFVITGTERPILPAETRHL